MRKNGDIRRQNVGQGRERAAERYATIGATKKTTDACRA